MYFRQEHQTLRLRFETDTGTVLVRAAAREPFPLGACPAPENVCGVQVAVLRDDTKARGVDWFCTAMDGALWRYLVTRDAANTDAGNEGLLNEWALAVRMGQEAELAARAVNHRENDARGVHRALATDEVQRALQEAAEMDLPDRIEESGWVAFLCLRQGIEDSAWNVGVQYLRRAGEASWRWVGSDGWVVPIRRKSLQCSLWQADSPWPHSEWPARGAQERRLLAERAIDALVDSHSGPYAPWPFRDIARHLTEAVCTFVGAVEHGEQTAGLHLDHAVERARRELSKFVADKHSEQETTATITAQRVLSVLESPVSWDYTHLSARATDGADEPGLAP